MTTYIINAMIKGNEYYLIFPNSNDYRCIEFAGLTDNATSFNLFTIAVTALGQAIIAAPVHYTLKILILKNGKIIRERNTNS